MNLVERLRDATKKIMGAREYEIKDMFNEAADRIEAFSWLFSLLDC